MRKRELEGKFLLAAKAALRGHRVMLGYVDGLLARGVLAPGIFHDKSLTPRPKKFRLLRMAKAAGLAFTSIDEEHGLLPERYDGFAAQRYSGETLELADAVMFWGPHDFNAMRRIYPAYESKYHMTGNPRADLWRPDMAAVFEQALPVRRPFVLFNSNLGAIVGKRSLAEVISAMREGYFKGDEDEAEFAEYRQSAFAALLCGEYVRALRRLARLFPEVDFVLRPHPTESPEAWRQLIGSAHRNIIVTYEGSVTPWIRQCAALVHNGCTTAMEAVRAGVPVLTYMPVPAEGVDFQFPNRLGTPVRDIAALVDAVETVLRGNPVPSSNDGRAVLDERFADTGEALAADRIVDIWDRLTQPHHAGKSLLRGGAMAKLRAAGDFVDIYRYATPRVLKLLGARKIPVMPQKFDVLTQSELDALKERFSRRFPDFGRLAVKQIAPRICTVERSAR